MVAVLATPDFRAFRRANALLQSGYLPQDCRGPVSATTIHVCTTCRATGEALEPREERAGFRLWQALTSHAESSAYHINPVECLSVCKRPCTVAMTAPGKWTYVYGDLAIDTAPAIILAGAALYEATPDGIVAWKSRPEALKKGVVARLPPLVLEPSS